MKKTATTPDPLTWIGIGVFVLLLHIVLRAFFLRAACWLFNHMAGGPRASGSVPEPSFGKSALIVVMLTLILELPCLTVFYGFYPFIFKFPQLYTTGVATVARVWMLITLALGGAALFAITLPTKLWRALIILLIEAIISVCFVLLTGGIVWAGSVLLSTFLK